MEAEIGPLLEETAVKTGLQALRRHLGSDSLLQFPTRPNGTPLLLRQSFFERLFSRNLELLDFQATDVNAAQVDLKNLDLPQLLFIQCENLDFQAASPAVKAQADFLATASSLIEKKVSERLVQGGGRAWGESSRASDVVRQVYLAYSAHSSLAEEGNRSALWLLRHGTLEALLHLPTCELRRVQASEDQLSWCHRSLSQASGTVPKARRKLHWQVELVEKPAEFKDDKKASTVAEERRARIGQREKISTVPRTNMMSEQKLQDAFERASAEVNRLKKELEESKQEVLKARTGAGLVTDVEKRLRQELDALKISLAEKSNECPELKEMREELTSVKSKLEAKCKECEDTKPEIERLQKELSMVQSSLEEKVAECTQAAADQVKLDEELASARSMHEKECKEHEEARSEIERLRQELSAASASVKANAEQVKLQEELASARSMHKTECKEHEETRSEIERLRQELSAASASVKAEHMISWAENLANMCLDDIEKEMHSLSASNQAKLAEVLELGFKAVLEKIKSQEGSESTTNTLERRVEPESELEKVQGESEVERLPQELSAIRSVSDDKSSESTEAKILIDWAENLTNMCLEDIEEEMYSLSASNQAKLMEVLDLGLKATSTLKSSILSQPVLDSE